MSFCLESPQPGDLVFVGPGGFSGFVQKLVDPDADKLGKTFAHVALLVTRTVALEAYPEEGGPTGAVFRLPHSVDKGQWTEVELRAGVRFIPVADIVYSAINGGSRVDVLRAPAISEASSAAISPVNRYLTQVVGSRYSLDPLNTRFGRSHPIFKWFASAVIGAKRWSSTPHDFATELGLSNELAVSIQKNMPDLLLPAVSTFFCSQLVVDFLTSVGVLQPSSFKAYTTPSGLYHGLIRLGWGDVSAVYAWSTSQEAYQDGTRLSHSSAYYSSLAQFKLARDMEALTTSVNASRSALAAMDRLVDGLEERIDRLRRS